MGELIIDSGYRLLIAAIRWLRRRVSGLSQQQDLLRPGIIVMHAHSGLEVMGMEGRCWEERGGGGRRGKEEGHGSGVSFRLGGG